MYVNLLSFQVKPCQEDPTLTAIKIQFEDEEPEILYPSVLQGGQRLLLSGGDADRLIQALLEGTSFLIIVGRNRLEVIPDNFSEAYEALLDITIDEDPEFVPGQSCC